jgi:hypothetical protein
MYNENEVKEPAVVNEEPRSLVIKPETTVKDEKNEAKVEKPAKPVAKKNKKKRSVVVESFSRAPLREKEEAVISDPKESREKEQ